MTSRSLLTPKFIDLAAIHDEIRTELDSAWRNVASTNAYIGGDFVGQFETRWAEATNRSHCAGVGSGTEAIELALRVRDIGPGDEVILPSMTFVATAAAVVATGATPVYVDVDPVHILLDVDQAIAAIGPKTRAIIAVHLYGNPLPFDRLIDATQGRNIILLEDAAQAHGASIQGKTVGSLGDMAAFSFYPSKNLGAFGDGGAVVTDNSEDAARIKRIGSHGRATTGNFEFLELGRTSRLDGLQAAILNVKLGHLDRWNSQRRQVMDWYRKYLDPELAPIGPLDGSIPAPHLCVVQVANRDDVRSELNSHGIPTAIHYHEACHETKAVGATNLSLPVSERAAATVLSLPLHPHLSEAEVKLVSERLSNVATAI